MGNVILIVLLYENKIHSYKYVSISLLQHDCILLRLKESYSSSSTQLIQKLSIRQLVTTVHDILLITLKTLKIGQCLSGLEYVITFRVVIH